MFDLLVQLEDSSFSLALRSLPWGFPIAEALHFVGLCLLMGSLAVIDLRLLGFGRSLSIRAVHQLLPWAWAGFALNAITGVFFFLNQPTFYYPNTAFRVKLVLMLLAGANALWFELRVHGDLDSWPDAANPSAQVKTMAGASLVLWIAVICFGRFIMYWPPF
jgi:hypothetical protein